MVARCGKEPTPKLEGVAAAAEMHLGRGRAAWRWILGREGGRPEGADLSPPPAKKIACSKNRPYSLRVGSRRKFLMRQLHRNMDMPGMLKMGSGKSMTLSTTHGLRSLVKPR